VLLEDVLGLKRGFNRENRTGRTVKITHSKPTLAFGHMYSIITYLVKQQMQCGGFAINRLPRLLKIQAQVFPKHGGGLCETRKNGLYFNEEVSLLAMHPVNSCHL
jgi:hypothetical protein